MSHAARAHGRHAANVSACVLTLSSLSICTETATDTTRAAGSSTNAALAYLACAEHAQNWSFVRRSRSSTLELPRYLVRKRARVCVALSARVPATRETNGLPVAAPVPSVPARSAQPRPDDGRCMPPPPPPPPPPSPPPPADCPPGRGGGGGLRCPAAAGDASRWFPMRWCRVTDLLASCCCSAAPLDSCPAAEAAAEAAADVAAARNARRSCAYKVNTNTHARTSGVCVRSVACRWPIPSRTSKRGDPPDRGSKSTKQPPHPLHTCSAWSSAFMRAISACPSSRDDRRS